MILRTPATRISIGLVLLTVSILLVADLIGLAPDRSDAVLEARKSLSESLAIQFSAAADRGDISLIRGTLQSIVERDGDILSAALRTNEGELLALAGDHLAQWEKPDDEKSTSTHVQVPIYRAKAHWATVEIRFVPLWVNDILSGFKNSFLGLVLFVAFTGFVGYFILMKRTLRELDPSEVIPGRVSAAFDVLEEGVLILDENEHIVLANKSIADLLGKSSSQLLGYKGSELGWKGCKSEKERKQLPWIQVLKNGKSLNGIPLVLENRSSGTLKLIVNAAPVLDNKGKSRGVLVTLADITELEEKNFQLSTMVDQLKVSTEAIQTKNLELEFLATHDPLTLCLNRRALNKKFDSLFTEAQRSGSELSSMMVDIDHFKLVNDKYGHPTGDKVIKTIAALLKSNSRDSDLVSRYGGEEFCLVLPGISIEVASEIAERIRLAIKNDLTSGISVTVSLGVSNLKFNAHEPGELINQADKALYIAKESGRNRVICWGGDDALSYTKPSESDNSADIIVDKNEQVDNESESIISNDNIECGDHDEIHRLTVRIKQLEGLAEKRSKELQHFAAYDVQTGLPTRTLFHDRIKQALARGNRYDSIVAVLVLSNGVVKRINEIFGHSYGEVFLKESAKRLTEALRAVDTVAMLESPQNVPTVSMLGQEEFAILLTDIQQVDHITWIVKRILDSFDNPFIIDGNEIYGSAYVGISIYPHDGESAETLQKNAFAANNYARKQSTGNRYRFHSKEINEIAVKQLKIEAELHSALKNEEFLLYYQPKIDAASGSIIGAEALIRWDSSVFGFVTPYDFIGIAEHSGLINAIGDWVLSTACKQAREWLDSGIECPVAVNFSPRQFKGANLVKRIEELLDEYQLTPRFIEIEITETSMMSDIGESIKFLRQIDIMGIAIAIDDFGTGYSSLGYLKNVPATHVKIDRSFVADIETDENDASLVSSIINMAHGLGLSVIAEGVEEESQINILREYGCDQLQGYFFSRPVPAIEATELLRTGLSHIEKLWRAEDVG